MHDPYLNPTCIILYDRRAACRWWSVRSRCDKQEVRCRACLNLSRLRYSCQRCTPAVAQHCHAMPFTCMSSTKCTIRGRSIFGKYLNAHLKFTVYGRKQARLVVYTHLRNAVPLVWGSLRLAPIKTHKWPTFSMAELPDLPGEPHQPVLFPFSKGRFGQKKIALSLGSFQPTWYKSWQYDEEKDVVFFAIRVYEHWSRRREQSNI